MRSQRHSDTRSGSNALNVMAITAALDRGGYTHRTFKTWSRVMTPDTNTTSKKMREPVREPTRELTELTETPSSKIDEK